jgi:hypothetical protein
LIIKEVTEKLNLAWETFKNSNTYYNGNFSVIGHSLGAMKLYDILSNYEVLKKLI